MAMKVTALLLWVGVSFIPSTTAVFVQGGEWYDTLNRPVWTPPNWVFGPMWTLLYTLMGVAAWRIWLRHGYEFVRVPLMLFLVHLFFNAAWTWLFFGLHLIVVAAVEITILWLFILVLMTLFFRYDRTAGWLLLPYFLWVSYAVTLNIGFVVLN